MGQHHHLYNNNKWRSARIGYLRKHPLCVVCQRDGHITEATVVDHIKPHRGDMKLFWNSSNWQSLCAHHHSSYKQRLERRGLQEIGTDSDGIPLDPSHHWNS